MGLSLARIFSRATSAVQARRARWANLRGVARGAAAGPASLEPVWPLPRRADGPDDEAITRGFAGFPLWHYSYALEGGLSFGVRRNRPGPFSDRPERPLQRFRHFMPWLLDACGGSLAGKSVLDIGCNSGFWSIQCALLGAREVVGFDARADLIAQAKLLRSIVPVDNVEFRQLDFWSMRPEVLGRRFDVVLNLGLLYHLPKPLEALDLTRAMSRDLIVLDTALNPEPRRAIISCEWETAADVGATAETGMVAFPSAAAVELMLRHLHFRRWQRLPLRSADMPPDYMTDRRATWLINV